MQSSPLYKDNEVTIRNMMAQAKQQLAGLNEIERIFIGSVSANPQGIFFMEQLKTDPSSAEVLRSGGGRATVEGLEVAMMSTPQQGTLFMTRVAPKMVLVTLSRETMQTVIRQSKGPAAKLDEAMERALADVNSEDSAFVVSSKMMIGTAMPMGGMNVKAIALGFSFSNDVSVRIAAVAGDATESAALLQKMKPMMGSQTAEMPQLKSILDKLEMSSSGDMAHVHGKWAYSELKGLVSQFSSMAQSMNGGNQ